MSDKQKLTRRCEKNHVYGHCGHQQPAVRCWRVLEGSKEDSFQHFLFCYVLHSKTVESSTALKTPCWCIQGHSDIWVLRAGCWTATFLRQEKKQYLLYLFHRNHVSFFPSQITDVRVSLNAALTKIRKKQNKFEHWQNNHNSRSTFLWVFNLISWP